EPNVPTAPVVGITPGENIHIRVDCQVVNVPHPVIVNFHFRSVRTDPDDAAAQHGQLVPFPVGCVVKPEIPDCNVDPPVNAHPDSVGGMVGTAALQKLRIADVPDQGLGGSVRHPV